MREVGVSSTIRAMCSQRNAYQPPPATATASISTVNQTSDGSAKQLP
jgi:hypothetical protein